MQAKRIKRKMFNQLGKKRLFILGTSTLCKYKVLKYDLGR